jgi:hypothetical protein
VLSDVVRDAWQQYRRHPLAVVPPLALSATLLLNETPMWVQVATLVVIIPLQAMVDLFLISWLAGVVDGRQTRPATALREAVRAFWPGVLVLLIQGAYAWMAVLVGHLLFRPTMTGTPDAHDTMMFNIGVAPLVAFAVAFLAVSVQPVVLDGERSALRAAARSHMVARNWFGICLLLGTAEGVSWALQGQPWGLPAMFAAAAAMAVVHPFLIGMANALYLRAKVVADAETKAPVV